MTTLSVESTGTTTAGLRQFEKQIRISSTSENDLFVQTITFFQGCNICEEIFAKKYLRRNICEEIVAMKFLEINIACAVYLKVFFIIHPNN
jgi:hypothetical protein